MKPLADILSEAELRHGAGDQAGSLAILRAGVGAEASFVNLQRLATWAKGRDWSSLPSIRVAFLGGGTLNILVDMILAQALLKGLWLVPYLPPYDTWRTQILDPQSALYGHKPEVAWLFNQWRDFHFAGLGAASAKDVEAAIARRLEEAQNWWRLLGERLPGAQLVQNNSDPAPWRLYGHLEATTLGSLTNQVRDFNCRLPLAAQAMRVALFDLDRLAAEAGLGKWHSLAHWYDSKQPFSPLCYGHVAKRAATLLLGLKEPAKKVLALDLDGTIWGGIVGDDGPKGIVIGDGPEGEAFADFQAYLKALSSRGVLLVAISKNDEAVAKAPFNMRPEMQLALDDFVAFKANWRDKADNLRDIATGLNLGLDSFVFLDDSPAERARMRAELPMVATVEMPREPEGYIGALEEGAYFETSQVTGEDADRARMYRENARRLEFKRSESSLSSYLEGLGMVGSYGDVDTMHLPRMAQLVNKTNQFNLTGARMTEAELAAIRDDRDHLARWYSLKDRFGDYGLVSVAVLRRESDAWSIEAWVMSCRVFERGLEEFVLRDLVGLVFSRGGLALVGLYKRTPRNGAVASLYHRLGFEAAGDEGRWKLELPTDRSGHPLFIEDGGRKKI